MQSSRLPGKVLMDIAGKSMLGRVVSRLRCCRLIDDIVVATSTCAADDVVEAWAKREGVHVHRGSEDDVLARVVGAQRALQADIVVEICGDMPLVDPEVVDLAVENILVNDCDVVTTVCVQSYPQGIDAEVFWLAALEKIEQTVSDPAVREHVSLYFYEHPEQYKILNLLAPACWSRPELRLQLDYPEDHEFVTKVYQRLEPSLGGTFGVGDVIELLEREPALAKINRHCEERQAR